jgi:hypothetical protein
LEITHIVLSVMLVVGILHAAGRYYPSWGSRQGEVAEGIATRILIASQTIFADWDQEVETFPSNGPDQSFAEGTTACWRRYRVFPFGWKFHPPLGV